MAGRDSAGKKGLVADSAVTRFLRLSPPARRLAFWGRVTGATGDYLVVSAPTTDGRPARRFWFA
jgi:hypothetical protein